MITGTMTKTQTRRQREEKLIERVWAQAKVDELHPGDLKEVLDSLRASHKREDTLREALSLQGYRGSGLILLNIERILEADA
jgi:hypothetical protein